MRFIEHGPDIPDELLLALDEERVVFFCGAGVSQEDAGLPDFFKLAENVLKDLRVSKKSPAYKILKEVPKIEIQLGVPGLIAADRIFGELEKTISTEDIEKAVAESLQSPKNISSKAHKTLLKLATTKDKRTRLVTTNFDRLFEKHDSRLKTWQRPHLPDSSEISNFEGLVYLHGRVNENYSGSDKGFILSSAEFGRAYLSEGWATQFFKEIISEYVVVFVGYGADDPPVYYLLEALNKKKRRAKDIYAFQSGTAEDAEEKWQHKGVTAIPYDAHESLWKTLAAWAKRAESLESWQDKIIKMAQKNPEQLLPFQREQVMHLVSTLKGAQRFCASDNPPPATWLCVFDSAMRFKIPTTIRQKNGKTRDVDYFKMYGLASDIVPEPVDPNSHWSRREVPPGSWDAFLPNAQDMRDARDYSLAPMKGAQALSVKNLPNRLYALGTWIAKVSDQPAAVWWAVQQQGIYQKVQERIRLFLQDKTDVSPDIAKAWHYLFDNWNLKPSEMETHSNDWFLFKKDIKKFGWNIPMVRRYEEMAKPRMTVRLNFWGNEIPPQKNAKLESGQLVDLDILYKEDYRRIDIPDECLANVVAALRRNLDIAIRLELEKGLYNFIPIPPIITSDDPDISGHSRTYGFAGPALYYASLFERLLKLNPTLAQAEIEKWDKDDDNFYARLRIWSCGIMDNDIGAVFSIISRHAFWNSNHQRDLLHTLKIRWAVMLDATRLAIEARILQGDERWEDETQKKYTKYRDWGILERLDWLKNNGCFLSAATEKEMARLKKTNPEYTSEHAKDADKSLEGRGGWVSTDTEHSALLELPLADILPKAKEKMGRSDSVLTENDPFAGLCETRPARAFAALRYEAKQGNHRAWAWRNFLQNEKRKTDSVRMKRFIAEMLVRLPDEVAVQIIHALANWTSKASEQLTLPCVPVFERLAKHLVKVMHQKHKLEDFSRRTEGSDYDWGFQAINSSAGILAEALFGDLRIKNLETNQSPPPNWINLAQNMLNLPDDLGRYALLTFTYRLNWFYYVNPQWTHDNLLQPLFDKNPDTTDAWWAGYLSGVRQSPAPDLFAKIKSYLLARVSDKDIEKRSSDNKMIQLTLLNWMPNDKGKACISDEELHDILLYAGDNFRVRALWEIDSFCEKDANPPYWKNKRLHLLEKVWPLERRAKTAQTTARLIELALDDEPEFPRLAKAIIPLLGKITDSFAIMSLRKADNNIIDVHPKLIFEIMHKSLAERDDIWQKDIKNTLDRIATADPELTRDPRFKELQRRWAAR